MVENRASTLLSLRRRERSRRFIRLGVAVGLASLSLVSCLVQQPPAIPSQPVTPPATDTAFTSPIATPTTLPTVIPTAAPGENTGRIAFHSERTGDMEIWVMNGDGSDEQQLTTAAERDIEPAWSPDGAMIAFASARDDPENLQLYLMDADGGNQRPVFPETQGHDNWSPRWSPDGTRLVYHSNREAVFDGSPRIQFDIYSVNLDGTDERRLTDDPRNDYMPDWSPDGTTIAFVSDRVGPDALYLMDADGSNQRRLLPDSAWRDYRPRWSPDGSQILFVSDRTGIPQMFIVAADGGEPQQVGPTNTQNVYPAWAFGGESILYSGEVTAVNWDIYRMNRDGSGLVVLTDAPLFDRYPDWTP